MEKLRRSLKKMKSEDHPPTINSHRVTELSDIPEEVTEMFPYFRVNDLLRLRRACKWAKIYADNFLQKHTPSQTTVALRIGCHNNSEEETPLMSTFLREDGRNQLRIPTSRFKLIFTNVQIFQQRQCLKFLGRYGNQIKHLEVAHMHIPMEDSEFEFYGKLSKLKSLTVVDICEVSEDEDGAEERKGKNKKESSILFPESFKTLRTIKIENYNAGLSPVVPAHLWKLVELCKNLEHLRLPDQENWNEDQDFETGREENVLSTQFEGLMPENPWNTPLQVKEMLRILERKEHSRFRVLDIAKLNGDTWGNLNKNLVQDLIELATKYNVKLNNVLSIYLSSIEGLQLENMASQISSVNKHFDFPQNNPFKGITLQNLNSLGGLVWSCLDSHLQGLKGQLTAALFPGLRKLEVFIFLGSGVSLEYMWSTFPNLEEVTIGGYIEGVRTSANEQIGDQIFFGSVKKKPAFLQLKNLKRLSLSRADQLQSLTDASFLKIFSQMKLRAFNIVSEEPVSSFTRKGLEALLSGPFMETIEEFPFHTWKLSGIGDKKFGQLAKQFPCNKET